MRKRERPIKMSKWWIERLLYRALKCPSKLDALAVKQLATEIKTQSNNALTSSDNASLIVTRKRNGVIQYNYSENYLDISSHRTFFRMHDSLSMNNRNNQSGGGNRNLRRLQPVWIHIDRNSTVAVKRHCYCGTIGVWYKHVYLY